MKNELDFQIRFFEFSHIPLLYIVLLGSLHKDLKHTLVDVLKLTIWYNLFCKFNSHHPVKGYARNLSFEVWVRSLRSRILLFFALLIFSFIFYFVDHQYEGID